MKQTFVQTIIEFVAERVFHLFWRTREKTKSRKPLSRASKKKKFKKAIFKRRDHFSANILRANGKIYWRIAKPLNETFLCAAARTDWVKGDTKCVCKNRSFTHIFITNGWLISSSMFFSLLTCSVCFFLITSIIDNILIA